MTIREVDNSIWSILHALYIQHSENFEARSSPGSQYQYRHDYTYHGAVIGGFHPVLMTCDKLLF
jgi:hypothetical protein